MICYPYPIDRVWHGVPELRRGQPRGEEVLRRLRHAPARALHRVRGREPARQEILCRLRRCADHPCVQRTGRGGITPTSRTDVICRTPAAHRAVLRSGWLDGARGRAWTPRTCARSSASIIACVAETVARFDGFVAKYMGDGVLVYFGYPQAHEDDAEQAVRAGLALVDAVGRLQASAAVAGPCRHRHRAWSSSAT